MSSKQVIVIRKDLKMRKGKMISQGAHASLGALLKLAKREIIFHDIVGCVGHKYTITARHNTPLHEWLEGIFTKIVVGCDSEEELLELYEKAKEENLTAALIQDAGKTEFHGEKTYTALAIGPDYSTNIDKITGHLKLL